MRKDSDTGRHAVAVVAGPGVPLFELAVAVEVFGLDRSDITAQWYDFTIAGLRGRSTAIAHDIAVPTEGLSALEAADTVVVPACRDVHEQPPANLLDALRAADARGARIAAICSGAFVLAAAGLLDGRRATTHWMHAKELSRRHPQVVVDPSVLYVHDRVWTSAGSAAGLDMCLELVRVDHGSAVANEVARRIVTPPHRDGGQAQYVRAPGGGHRDAAGAGGVLDWARGNLQSATIAGMAHHAGVSDRTLHRRFARQGLGAPHEWLQNQRIGAAAELFETTDLTVDAVAHRVGLGTGANLRAHFATRYGVPPTSYRKTFRG